MSDLNLDRKDRLMLANQFRILERIDPHEAEYYRRAVRILEDGYEYEYESLFRSIYDGNEKMTVEQCQEVIDILQMYRVMKQSYEQLADKSGIDERELQFPGFDGHEGPYLSYGEFLNSEGKFAESPVVDSHSPSIAIYQRMLPAFRRVRDQYPLSKAQIRAILDERVHPKNRPSAAKR